MPVAPLDNILSQKGQRKFDFLRKHFPSFTYQSYSISLQDGGMLIKFKFKLSDDWVFEPELSFPRRSFLKWEEVPRPLLESFVFQLGLVESISYWKTACPEIYSIECGHLVEDQKVWWRKLFIKGLGEFFYRNGIQVSASELIHFRSEGSVRSNDDDFKLTEQVIIPVGGGKDSAVSLEVLKNSCMPDFPFAINPDPAIEACIDAAGKSLDKSIVARRKLDAQILEMNKMGFLNGHTPFSALIAFMTGLVAMGSRSRYIALSNESSANESTVAGSEVNHQYSKTFEFESDFRSYCSKYLHPDLEYFSFLRPVNEIQIAKIFSTISNYHPVFRSCNVGSKTNSWCGQCSKCLFTALILGNFMDNRQLRAVFGKNMLSDVSLLPILMELAGITEAKPFECVGTTHEVQASIIHALNENRELLQLFLDTYGHAKNQTSTAALLETWNEQHHLPDAFEEILKNHLTTRL